MLLLDHVLDVLVLAVLLLGFVLRLVVGKGVRVQLGIHDDAEVVVLEVLFGLVDGLLGAHYKLWLVVDAHGRLEVGFSYSRLALSVFHYENLVNSHFLVEADGRQVEELVLLLRMDLAAIDKRRVHNLTNQVKLIIILVILPVTMRCLLLIEVPDPYRAIRGTRDQIIIILAPRHVMNEVIMTTQHDLKVATLVRLAIENLDDGLVVLEGARHSQILS